MLATNPILFRSSLYLNLFAMPLSCFLLCLKDLANSIFRGRRGGLQRWSGQARHHDQLRREHGHRRILGPARRSGRYSISFQQDSTF